MHKWRGWYTIPAAPFFFGNKKSLQSAVDMQRKNVEEVSSESPAREVPLKSDLGKNPASTMPTVD